METLQKLALAVTIIGALNWGVAGIFSFDVIAQMTDGAFEPLTRFLYILIGLSGLMTLGVLFSYWQRTDDDAIPASEPENI